MHELRRAVKILAAAAADNFGWIGGAPSVFRRRRRRMIPAAIRLAAAAPFGG